MICLVGPASSTELPLPVQTRDAQRRLDEMYDAGRLPELINPHAFLAGLVGDFPTPPATPWPKPRIGVLYWPVVGLAHYAFATFLVDEWTVQELRAQMTGTGSNAVIVRFYDDPEDDTETGRDVTMYALATRPLVRTTDAALTTEDNTDPMDAWVITLVDDRYRALHTSLVSLTSTDWDDVFSAAGVTVGDAVDADYLTPSDRWTTDRSAGRSLAWLADVAALSVGSRIVTVPGNAPTLQRPTGTRKTTLETSHTDAADLDRFFGGGPIDDADVEIGQPNTLRVVFGASCETSPVEDDITIQTTYEGGASAVLSHWCDAPASTSSTPRTTLATKAKDDWSAWQLGCYDTLYSGTLAAPDSGFCWAVEWRHTGETQTTRFVRPPHWYGYLLAPYVDTCGGGITVEDSDHSPSYSGITTIQFPSSDGFTVSNPSAGVAKIDISTSPTIAHNQTNTFPFGYSISANTTWEDTGFNIALPSAGTYLLFGRVTAEASASVVNPANAMSLNIATRLYDVTNSAVIPSSYGIVAYIGDTDVDPTVAGGAGDYRTSTLGPVLFTVSGTCTVRLEGFRSADDGAIANWSVSQIIPDDPSMPELGGTHLGYIKIA